MSELNFEGLAVAPGVVETIVSLATQEVEGVAAVGSATANPIRSVLGAKPSTQGVEVSVDEDSKLNISVRVEVLYGYALPTVAANIRKAIADAVKSQVGVSVNVVDVYIDAIQFAR